MYFFFIRPGIGCLNIMNQILQLRVFGSTVKISLRFKKFINPKISFREYLIGKFIALKPKLGEFLI